MTPIAASHISASADVTDKQLKSALAQRMDPPRRVDRLILSSLLGCATLQTTLSSNCGLYLAARYPCRPNMQSLMEAVCLSAKQPKPFEFVNSVSNAAGFHIAQRLGLEGPNLFIGANQHTWERLLELASLDLNSGVVEQALLVYCDNPNKVEVFCLLLQGPGPVPSQPDFNQLSQHIKVHSLHLDAAS